MPSTSVQQEQHHKSTVAASEGNRQSAVAVAKATYNNVPANWPAYRDAVRNADAAHFRAVIASCQANNIGDGPRQSLFWLVGAWT